MMKQMTCAQMGGPADCTTLISGNSITDMVANGMKHVTAVHSKMAEDMKTMPKEDGDRWMTEFQAKWDAAPEM